MKKTTKTRINVKPIKRKSERSIKKYKSLLSLYLMNEKLSDYNKTFINLFDKQTSKHQPLSKETIRSCLSAIIWFIEDKKPNAEELLNNYRLLMAHLRKSCLFDTRNNILIKQVQMKWNDILQIRNDFKNKVSEISKKHPSIIINDVGKINNSKCELNLKEKALMKKYLISCIYTYNPPRRLLDYGCMNIITNIKEFEKLQKEHPKEISKHNYYAYENKVFIFCYYKTVKIYKTQYISVNNELDKIIKDYINLMGLKNRDLLFGNKDFEQLVRNTFNAGINTIRHSYISYLYESTRGRIDANMIDKVSLQMAHSVKTNIGYYKSHKDDELDTITFTFHREFDVFDNRQYIRLRLKNTIMMLMIFIVVKICLFRFNKVVKGKKNIKYLEETVSHYEIDDIMKK